MGANDGGHGFDAASLTKVPSRFGIATVVIADGPGFVARPPGPRAGSRGVYIVAGGEGRWLSPRTSQNMDHNRAVKMLKKQIATADMRGQWAPVDGDSTCDLVPLRRLVEDGIAVAGVFE